MAAAGLAAEGAMRVVVPVVRTEEDLSAVLASKDLPAEDLKATEEKQDNIVKGVVYNRGSN